MTARRLGRLGECRDCHDPIRFVTLPNDTRLPVNPRPGQTGRVAARLQGGDLHGYVISHDRPPRADYSLRFVPHAATCTDRPDRAPAQPDPTEAATDAALF